MHVLSCCVGNRLDPIRKVSGDTGFGHREVNEYDAKGVLELGVNCLQVILRCLLRTVSRISKTSGVEAGTVDLKSLPPPFYAEFFGSPQTHKPPATPPPQAPEDPQSPES